MKTRRLYGWLPTEVSVNRAASCRSLQSKFNEINKRYHRTIKTRTGNARKKRFSVKLLKAPRSKFNYVVAQRKSPPAAAAVRHLRDHRASLHIWENCTRSRMYALDHRYPRFLRTSPKFFSTQTEDSESDDTYSDLRLASPLAAILNACNFTNF